MHIEQHGRQILERLRTIQQLRNCEDSPFSQERRARIGDIELGYVNWGIPVSARNYKQHLAQREELTLETEQMIDSSGFIRGYHYPNSYDLFSRKAQDAHVQYGITLGESLLRRRNWKHIAFLDVGSNSSWSTIAEEISAGLRKKGYIIDSTRMYGLACYNAFASIVDRSRKENPEFHGQPGLTMSIESLSGQQVDPNDHRVWWTFGNGAAGLAWIPHLEIEHICGKTIVEPDTKGAMTIPLTFKSAPLEDRIPPPSGYIYAEGTDPGEQTRFYATKYGVFFDMHEAPNGKINIDSGLSFVAFGRGMPPLMREVEKIYEEEYASEYGPLADTRLMHQPSYPIIYAQEKELIRLALTQDYELTKKEAYAYLHLDTQQERQQYLADHAITNFVEPKLPWSLKEARVNNISGGAALVDATIKAQNGLLPFNQSIECDVYGIGITKGVHMIKIRKAA